MRIRSICVVTILLVLSPMASAQWVRIPQSPRGDCLAVSGPNLLVGKQSSRFFRGALYTSTDNGTTWDTIWAFSVHAFAVSGTKVYAGGDSLSLSTDNGLSWVGAGSTGHPITAVTVSGTNIFCGTSGWGVLLSTDNGQSWNALSPGWTSTIVWALAFSGANVFAGTTGGVVLSTDNGTSWSAANSGLPTLDVRALMTSGSTILAGVFQKGVFLSTNNGTTWSKANIGLSNNCGGKAFTSDGSHLFAATDGGVFLSSNGGISWSAANAGLTDTIVYALAVSGSNLLALTNSGVWRRPMSEMITSVEAEARVPMQFVLHQNYPNPFNPTTVISYHLPVLSDVKLAVYDLLGREVAVLVNEKMDAGVHEVRFEASALPSGMFFYRLNAGDFVQTKRLVVLK